MTEDDPVMQCPACGAGLPIVRYERTVTCTYCRATHANTMCLAPNSEVLVASEFGYDLTRVTSCDDPTAIALADRPGTFDLDDLIPVVRVTGPLAQGVEVFRRSEVAWVRTWTASAFRNGRARVKHPDAAFQSDFFDESASLDELRLDARASQPRGRTSLQAFIANLRADPISTLVSQCVRIVNHGMKAVFFLVFVIVAIQVALFVYRSI